MFRTHPLVVNAHPGARLHPDPGGARPHPDPGARGFTLTQDPASPGSRGTRPHPDPGSSFTRTQGRVASPRPRGAWPLLDPGSRGLTRTRDPASPGSRGTRPHPDAGSSINRTQGRVASPGPRGAWPLPDPGPWIRIFNRINMLDVDITELHSWITRSEAVLQSPEFAIYRKDGNFSDLKEKVNAIEREKAEKFRKLQDASRSAQALVEQMVNEGVNADSIKQASEQLNSRWNEFCQLLSERLNWLDYQNNIITFYNQLQQLEHMTTTADNWLKTQPSTISEPTVIKSQLKICKVQGEVEKPSGEIGAGSRRLHLLTGPSYRDWVRAGLAAGPCEGPERLGSQNAPGQEWPTGTGTKLAGSWDKQPRVPSTSIRLQPGFTAPSLMSFLLDKATAVFDALPPTRYQETMTTILMWIQQSESKLSIPQVTVTEYEIMEQRFGELQALQSSLREQQSGLNYLSTIVKEMSKKAPSDISQKYQSEFEDIEGRWKKLSSQLVEHCQKLEEHMAKLRKIQVYARKEALKEGLDKTVSLQKDLSEMHEWMTQAEEEYLERDFEYKTPDELQKAVEEMKRAKEEAQQKEAKVKLLTESVNSVIAQAPPVAQEALKKELDTLTTNYQWLCTRLNGKCKTLENSSCVAGSGRCPHILYLCLLPSMVFIQKKQECDRRGGSLAQSTGLRQRLSLIGAETTRAGARLNQNPRGARPTPMVLVTAAQLTWKRLHTGMGQAPHGCLVPERRGFPGVQALASQGKVAGGVKASSADTPHSYRTFVTITPSTQAVRRQKLLEQSIQSAQEIEKSLHLIQESLSSIDKQLAAYIADKNLRGKLALEFFNLRVFYPNNTSTQVFLLTFLENGRRRIKLFIRHDGLENLRDQQKSTIVKGK
ncbi:hypothetical protein QTO34_000802 [Cnephaeus nilssonii]|uniref:Dystrophin n=1 Tax=Cnephaeus nilssonii TaxID=3371016 RepID=A0AA40IC30_CNENI|nr:hypothetical protein QTO34_000802 [Eptesicus nilssonii]